MKNAVVFVLSFLAGVIVTLVIVQFFDTIKSFHPSTKALLHNSVIVTEINYTNDNFCEYQLSQTINDQQKKKTYTEKKFKIKTVCGMYSVPDQLILTKGISTNKK